jgi:hypothetical protein
MPIRRWVLLVVVVLVAVGLIAFARGPQHHRGDDVGALGPGAQPVAVLEPAG